MSETIIGNADALSLVARRARSRAGNYRERASQLRAMAEIETIERVRDRLLSLADQYDRLAAGLG